MQLLDIKPGKLYSQKKAAEILDVNVQTVRARIAAHELTAYDVAGNCVKVPGFSILRYLESRRKGRDPKSYDTRPRVLAQGDHLFESHHEDPATATTSSESTPATVTRKRRGRRRKLAQDVDQKLP